MILRRPPPPRSTTAVYARLLWRLLPRGPLWQQDDTTELGKAILGCAAELSRFHNRLLDLLDESDPRTTTELIGQWETVLGLPDPVLGELTELADRRAMVTGRETAIGGQSAAYFIAIAASIGLTVTISPPCQPARAGIARAGDHCWSEAWAFGWIITAPAGPERIARAGIARAGDRLIDVRQPVLESLIWRYAPAHTIPVFAYIP